VSYVVFPSKIILIFFTKILIFRRCRVLTDFVDIVAYLTIPVEKVEDVSVEENAKKCDKGEVDSADIENLKYMYSL
jgi:hypothetical protein